VVGPVPVLSLAPFEREEADAAAGAESTARFAALSVAPPASFAMMLAAGEAMKAPNVPAATP
jgi:hypothetical protein